MPKSPTVAGTLLIVLILAHLVGAAILLPRLTFHADLTVDTDQDARIAAAHGAEQRFPAPNPLLFLVPDEGNLFSVDTRTRLTALVALLESRDLTVRSALSLKGSPSWVDTLQATPLYQTLFLNPGRDAWVVYVPTHGDGQTEAARVQDVETKMPGVVSGGEPWVRFLMDRALARNLAWLLPLSLLVVAVVFLIIVRSPGKALWLTVASSLPALDVLFLFPVLGLSFNFTTILAPLLLLAITKKYNLWVHHHIETYGPDPQLLRNRLGRAITWSASVSSLGFASLWVSPLPSLRLLGLLLVVGLALTLFWALVAVPALSRAFPSKTRQVPPRDKPWSDRRWIRWALGLVLVAAIPGVAFVSSAGPWRDYLDAGSQEARALDRFEALYPAWEEASLVLSWPGDAGWLVPARWQALASLIERWRTEHPSLHIWSAQDAVAGTLSALGSSPQSRTSEDLGQALELLPPESDTGKLIDGSRSQLILRMSFPSSELRQKEQLALFDTLEDEARWGLAGVQVTWAGPLYRQTLGMEEFLRGEAWGTLSFFLMTGAAISFRLRSIRKGLLALVPALTSAVVFLGLAGWLRWPLSPATALVIAASIGQTTDDGLLWSLLPLTRAMRAFFLESTLLLSAALLVLAGSSFANINQAAYLVIAALLFSTSVVLWVLPWRLER